jgi:hypothetical protein
MTLPWAKAGSLEKMLKTKKNIENWHIFLFERLVDSISPCPLSGFPWNEDHIHFNNVYLLAHPWAQAEILQKY